MYIYKIIILCGLLLGSVGLKAQEAQCSIDRKLRADSTNRNRIITRATMYGVGFTNVFDTYLSPQEYKGIDFRISRESMRMTRLMDGNVSLQTFFQADLGYTHNKVDNNNTFSGLANWNYGLHYNFPITGNFKLLAGGVGDFNGGFVYNLRNGNNPAQARAYINLAASGMAIWDLRIKNPSHHTTLSGKSSFGRYHVHAQLWTVLLRDIYVRTLGRSSELHLPAQPALSETNADRRLSGGTCPDAFRLHMGRTTVQSK